MSTTSDIIIDFIRNEVLKDADHVLDPEENLLASGLIDSVGIMRLVRHLEQTLSLSIPAGDLVPGNFRTVAVMAAYLDGLRETAGN